MKIKKILSKGLIRFFHKLIKKENEMAIIKLGNRDLGEIEVIAESVNFEQIPSPKTSEKVYLKIDRDNMKDFVRYYDALKEGDLVEGISSNKPYWELLGIEVVNGVFREMMSPKEVDELYIDWNFFNDRLPSSMKFIIQVN